MRDKTYRAEPLECQNLHGDIRSHRYHLILRRIFRKPNARCSRWARQHRQPSSKADAGADSNSERSSEASCRYTVDV